MERYDFLELSEVDRRRVYAQCYGNPMLMAEYINEKNKGMKSGYKVTFADVEKQLEGLSDEEKEGLKRAYYMRLDADVKRKMETEGGNFALKLAQRLHPDYALKSEVNQTNKVMVMVSHVDRASKMCGYDKEKTRKELGYEDAEKAEIIADGNDN